MGGIYTLKPSNPHPNEKASRRVPHLRDGLIVAKVGIRASREPSSSHSPQTLGCPILRALCEGWDSTDLNRQTGPLIKPGCPIHRAFCDGWDPQI